MRWILNTLGGSGIFIRAFRGASWVAIGYSSAQAIRLAANLILARVLFPEAFGLMALVMIFLIGLTMFSDVGLGPSIAQNKRGDDPDFLDTAWTIQVIRGACLWLGTCALALPVARFYGEPMLAQFLPVSGLALFIAGFNPTRIETAYRHLLLGRVAALDLATQVIGTAVMVAVAWQTRSVWALVVGQLVTATAKVVLCSLYLPGPSNRIRWDRSAARELLYFGKWIFLSTAAGFMINQADKAILGKYLSLEMLGIYNIGFFIATFPLYLGGTITARILIPLYRDRPPAVSVENFRKMRMTRFALSAGMLPLVMAMAYFGTALIGVLYDARYTNSGAVVVLVSCLVIPMQVIVLTYDQAALAAGDSRRFFYLVATKAAVQTVAFVVGAEMGGLIGALIAQCIAMIVLYPMTVWLARVYGAWDPLHDAICAVVCVGLGWSALWLNREAISALVAFNSN